MSKKDRTDRQAVIDSIRSQQSKRENRRGLAIVGDRAYLAQNGGRTTRLRVPLVRTGRGDGGAQPARPGQRPLQSVRFSA